MDILLFIFSLFGFLIAKKAISDKIGEARQLKIDKVNNGDETKVSVDIGLESMYIFLCIFELARLGYVFINYLLTL